MARAQSETASNYDIIIVGGGMVGISLALLLLNTPHDLQASIVIAVEAVARGALVVDLLFLAVLVEAADAAFFLFFAGMV